MCEDEMSRYGCGCPLNPDIVPGVTVLEAKLTSVSDLNLAYIAGDRRIPADFGPSKCNQKIPLHVYGRPGKFRSIVMSI